jgi:hypothetical protein
MRYLKTNNNNWRKLCKGEVKAEQLQINIKEDLAMKCKYYRKKGYCSKGNDPIDKSNMGDCIYRNGLITEKANIHCSEGKKLLEIKE